MPITLKNFLDKDEVRLFADYYRYKWYQGTWGVSQDKEGKPKESSRLFLYADPLAEALSISRRRRLSEILKKHLEPTYTFCRIYEEGRELTPHLDRGACQYSVTLNISNYPAEYRWPIYMKERGQKEAELTLDPGDAIVYKGCEVLHWRKPLDMPGAKVVQVMLHYVDMESDHSKHKWDGREIYGDLKRTPPNE